MKKILSCLLAVVTLLSLSSFSMTSCSGNSIYSEGNGELNVLCTVFAPFEFAREVGGDRVTVSILQDTGADLHNFTPTTATLDALSAADIFIYIGGESDEKWVSDTIAAAGNKDLVTIRLMDHIQGIHAELENDWAGHTHEHKEENQGHEGHIHTSDEHIWTSVKNVKLIVKALEKAFCEKDLDGSSVYSDNANAYLQKLDELDAKYEEAAADAKTKLLVFADRFPFVYLMHDYMIPYKAAFSGCSTEVNASFEMQADLINAVRDNGLDSILTIEGNNKSLAEAISLETGCKILTLNSMQSIKRSDIIDGADYIEIMTQNLDVLKEALN